MVFLITKDAKAGFKVIYVCPNDVQRDKIPKVFPTAKFDSATTKSIGLLPRKVKDEIFGLVIEKKSRFIAD